MAVAADISRAIMQEELTLAREFARLHKWGIVPQFGDLTVLVTMYAHTGDLFILEIRCDSYKELPPFFEFIDPDTGEHATKHAYPKGHDTFFHVSGPCICAPFNRKAYKAVVETGPHQDWQLAGWENSTANGTQWSNYSKLGDMLGLIQARLSRPEYYKGRMA